MSEPIPENIRRALGLAVAILEDMPERLQPRSNMEDMRELLAGGSTGRDGLIAAQAIATALAFRTWNAMTTKHDYESEAAWVGVDNLRKEFRGLFVVAAMVDPGTFAMWYTEACGRFAQASPDAHA
jgi:hypothetical protein